MWLPNMCAVRAGLLLLLAMSVAGGLARPAPPIIHNGRHTLVGELVKVDTSAKRIIVKTADGAEHAIRYTSRTAVHGLVQAGNASYLAGKEGSQVVVHYTEHGAAMTADGVDLFGHNALHATDGTLVRVNQQAHTVVIKSEDGAQHTYYMGRDAVVDTKDGVVDSADLAARKGDHVIVYHTEQGTRAVVHSVKDLASKF
jgi:hypothetical protein